MQIPALAGLCRLAVVGYPGLARSQNQFVSGGIANAAGDGNSILDHGNGNAELRNALDEFPRSIERIDDPHPLLVEAREVVHAFLRQPTLAVAEQVLAQHRVHRPVRLGDGIVAHLVFGLDRARSEAVQNLTRRFQGRVNALQSVV